MEGLKGAPTMGRLVKHPGAHSQVGDPTLGACIPADGLFLHYGHVGGKSESVGQRSRFTRLKVWSSSTKAFGPELRWAGWDLNPVRPD